MALRFLGWKKRLLGIGAGVLICASVGCSNTKEERRTQAPARTMGAGNTAMSPPLSPAFNNLAGRSSNGGNQVMYNPAPVNPNPSMGNPADYSSQSSPNRAAQGFVGQQFNPIGNPAVFNQAPQQMQVQPPQQQYAYPAPPLMPTNYGQPGFAPNGTQMYPMPPQQQMQMTPQQLQQMQMQPAQPQQMQQQQFAPAPQHPAMPNTSMNGFTVPDSLPSSVKEMRFEGPSLLPTSGIPVPKQLPVEPALMPPMRVSEASKKSAVTPVSYTPATSLSDSIVAPPEPVIPAPVTIRN